MIKPKKSLSQNFLIDKNIRKKIINISNIKNKNIIEIGPGKGFLTDGIIKEKPKKIILIEKDKYLFNQLKIKYKVNKNIKIYNKDFIKINLSNFENFIIISNLPYNITKKFFNKIFFCKIKFQYIILMIQKEVAKKINPKEKEMNKYKFLINLTSSYKICFNVSANVFNPKPKVDSTVVKIKQNKLIKNPIKIKKFIAKTFNNKRKKISNLHENIINNKNLKSKRIENLNFQEIKYLLKIF